MDLKSQKGLTLTTVIVYIIGMVIVATIIGNITIFFYNNITSASSSARISVEHAKFNNFFIEETKKENNRIIKVESNKIQFASGALFTYDDVNETIYRDNVKVCEYVSDFILTYRPLETKGVIDIFIEIDGKPHTTSYVVGRGY